MRWKGRGRSGLVRCEGPLHRINDEERATEGHEKFRCIDRRTNCVFVHPPVRLVAASFILDTATGLGERVDQTSAGYPGSARLQRTPDDDFVSCIQLFFVDRRSARSGRVGAVQRQLQMNWWMPNIAIL